MSEPKPFTIKGDAKLGTNIPFRTQVHGSEKVAAADVPFSDLMLNAEQLGELLQEPLAHRALYTRRPGTLLDDPLLKTIGPVVLLEKITGQVQVLSVTGQEEIDLGVCEIAKIKLTPRQGGLTAMAGSIQTTPTLDSRIGELLARMAGNVQVAINYEHAPEQHRLPGTENDPPPDPNYDKPGELTSSDGSTIPLKSGKQVDDEMEAERERRGAPAETMGADAKSAGDPEFEAAATAQVEAFKRGRRGPHRTNGRKGAH